MQPINRGRNWAQITDLLHKEMSSGPSDLTEVVQRQQRLDLEDKGLDSLVVFDLFLHTVQDPCHQCINLSGLIEVFQGPQETRSGGGSLRPH